ncbi:MAG: hypothetical protein KA712_06625 [Myxococcales bacterium]|nr:hypothetical protein [Myxococcales bacterium]
MFRGRLALLSCIALAPLLLSRTVRSARAAEKPAVRKPSGEPIMPLADVKPGMEGYGLTVFQGVTPERFKVKVVSVLRNFLPRQSVILMRVEDPRVEHTGVAAGMSGSPIYIDGKVVGALAYAWAFSKEPLAGVTPIEAMLEDGQRPLRPPAMPSLATDRGAAGARASQPLLGQAQLVPVGVPLAFSGVAPEAIDDVREAFSDLGLMPVSAGGGGGTGRPEIVPAIVPGGSVGVELVRGDMSVTATGTVTYVEGNTVLAFGHPMMRAGQVDLPMVGAEIHAIMPNLANAFKLASPLGEVGALRQDRGAAIVGQLGEKAPRVPLSVSVTRAGENPRPFFVDIAKNDALTPLLVSVVTSSAVSVSEHDPVDMVVDLTTKIELGGGKQVVLRDQAFSTAGLSPRLLSATQGFKAFKALLDNPFGRVDLRALSIEANVTYKRDTLEIVGVQIPRRPVRAGKPLDLRVLLRPFGGRDTWRTVSIALPHRIEGRTVDIEVASGATVTPFVPKPESLADLIASFGTYYTAGQLVVSVTLPETGAALRGEALGALPPSALDTLIPAHETRRAQLHRLFGRTVIESPEIVLGKASVKVRVDDQALGAND